MFNNVVKSMAELFSSTPPAATASAAQAAGPSQPSPQTNVEPMPSPLDSYQEIFKLAEKNAAENQNLLAAPLFDIDTAKLAESTSTMNFVNATTEDVQRAMQDPAAMIELLNHVARNAHQMGTQLNARLVESGATRRAEEILKMLPSTVRALDVNNHLHGDEQGKTLLHPSVAPVVQNVQQQFMAAHPGASAAEIARMTTEYFQTVAKGILPPQESNQRDMRQVSATGDFSKFFT
jgi:hypothetical protein